MKKFKSQIIWFPVFLGLILMCFVAFLFNYFWGMDSGLITILVSVFVLSGPFWQKYTIDNNLLIVRAFILQVDKIHIDKIKKIEILNLSKFWKLFFGNSLKIYYGKYDDIVIMPRSIQDFINELVSINPKIEIITLFNGSDIKISNSES